MNESVSAGILGIVQGLTEFLPVSSSGHLVLFQSQLPVAGDTVAFDLGLHMGTLLPVLWVYRADLARVFTDTFSGDGSFMQRPGVRLMALVILGSIPTAAIGLSLEDLFEEMFSNTLSVGIAFAVTGFLLWFTRRAGESKHSEFSMPWVAALIIGIVQGLAITPGISRSGSTIAAAMFLGIEREAAAKYSFLLSIPAILGAFVLKAGDLDFSAGNIAPLATGFVAAAVTGYLALQLLLKFVRNGSLDKFAIYLWPLAAVSIGMSLAG